MFQEKTKKKIQSFDNWLRNNKEDVDFSSLSVGLENLYFSLKEEEIDKIKPVIAEINDIRTKVEIFNAQEKGSKLEENLRNKIIDDILNILDNLNSIA